MKSQRPDSPGSAVFLDTTIQVDRVILKHDSEKCGRAEALVRQFDLRLAASYSRLEYKRVVLQNLALLLNYIESGGLTTAFYKISKLTRCRRDSTLNALLGFIFGEFGTTAVDAGDTLDKQCSMRAAAYIRNAIMVLWYQFDKMVDHIADQTKCQRALEKPVRKKNGTYDLAVHESACRQRTCGIVNLFQSELPRIKHLCESLERRKADGRGLTAELEKALAMLQSAGENSNRLYDYQNCLKVGDVWIHLEAAVAKVEHLATTNVRESEVLCPILDLQMHNP